MNNIIILTKKLQEGEKLRMSLSKFDETLDAVPCLTKEDVLNDPSKTEGCEYIFSTWFMPEFTEEEFYKAIVDYQKRERRFGKTSEQVKC